MKCEVCGCDHDGTYGSGRFCSHRCKQIFCGKFQPVNKETPKSAIKVVCPVCGIELSSKLAFRKHRKELKHYSLNRHHKFWRCELCGSVLSSRKELRKHICDDHNHINGKGPFRCKYCGKEFDRPFQIAAHTARCKLSPNYARNTEQMSMITKKRFECGLPESTKRKISDTMKKFYEEHQESASYRYNHYTKGSWAEDYFRDLFTKEGITGWEQQFHISRYRLDFAFVDKKIDFEVDGHQHYVDKRIVEHDKVRTANLEALGWKVIRIRWSSWNAMTQEQKRQWLNENLYRLVK